MAGSAYTPPFPLQGTLLTSQDRFPFASSIPTTSIAREIHRIVRRFLALALAFFRIAWYLSVFFLLRLHVYDHEEQEGFSTTSGAAFGVDDRNLVGLWKTAVETG